MNSNTRSLTALAGFGLAMVGVGISATRAAKRPRRFAKISILTTPEAQAEVIATLGATGSVPMIGRINPTHIVAVVGYQSRVELVLFTAWEIARLPGVKRYEIVARDRIQ